MTAPLDELITMPAPLVTFEQVREWLAEVEAGRWSWVRNTRCKYVDVKLDTRRGAYALHDRDGKPITYEQLRWQYGRESAPTHPGAKTMKAEEIVMGLTAGARRACIAMTDEWQFPGKATFDANGVYALYLARRASGRGSLCEREDLPDGKYKRAAFRLTPLGLEVRSLLQSMKEVG